MAFVIPGYDARLKRDSLHLNLTQPPEGLGLNLSFRQKTELDRKIDIKKVDIFCLQQMHETFGFFFTENKTDFHG